MTSLKTTEYGAFFPESEYPYVVYLDEPPATFDRQGRKPFPGELSDLMDSVRNWIINNVKEKNYAVLNTEYTLFGADEFHSAEIRFKKKEDYAAFKLTFGEMIKESKEY